MNEIDPIEIEHLRQFCFRSQRVEVSKGQAEAAVAAFLRQVRIVQGGCWLWNGVPTTSISCTNSMGRTDSLRIDSQHFACAIEYEVASCDHHSKFLPTCQTPLCIRPAHKVELVLLADAYWLLVDRGLGEDDLREQAWRFRERVENGDYEEYTWKGQRAARRDDFEQWLLEEGGQLEADFRQKYAQDTSAARTPFHARNGVVGWKRESFSWRRKSKPDWWERVAVPPSEIPLLTERYRQLARAKAEEAKRYRLVVGKSRGDERPESELDDLVLLKQIERLCMRLIVHENDCWTWDKPEVRFRLYQGGPLVSPHEVLWTIFSGVHVSPVWKTEVASHNGFSWCINPAHSDILANTSGAALLLFHQEDPPIVWPEGAMLSNEDHERLRHLIYRAIERGELPWMLDEHHGINVWRADILVWVRDHSSDIAEVAPLLFTSKERI